MTAAPQQPRPLLDRLTLRSPRTSAVMSAALMRLPVNSRLRRAALVDAFARGNRALNRGDLEATFAAFPENVEWNVLPDIAALTGMSAVLRSRAEAIQFLERILEVVDWSVEIKELSDLGGGRVLLRCVGHQTGAASGLSGDVPFSQLWEIEKGRVRRVRDFADHGEALAAAGST